jgi:dolichyl-diphosphooligosaccharide--protein glycosyltransferase
MAWWDYGYQITGIGNRTTIADGNTWNHEHIATLGRILSGTEKRSHRIARHIADYVLVWAGGGGDDLAKSPHMARIGNSVYRDICPGDPTCSSFGFYQGGVPTPMMANSLLYKLTQYSYKQEITLDPNRYQHVFTSKFGKCRVFKIKSVSKKSKDWVANPENRLCDAPGSWYCSGQYPPALHSLIAKRHNFKQLEDFNVGQDEESKKYNEEYHKRMSGDHTSKIGSGEEDDEDAPERKLKGKAPKFVGCYGKEEDLGDDKVYEGGATGANIALARQLAWAKGRKYVAIARVGNDGHSFHFDSPPSDTGKLSDEGCQRPCMDFPDHSCGCADEAGCGDLAPADGEEHVRRWAVYEMPPKDKKKGKKDKKDKKKKKGKKGKKDKNDEL